MIGKNTLVVRTTTAASCSVEVVEDLTIASTLKPRDVIVGEWKFYIEMLCSTTCDSSRNPPLSLAAEAEIKKCRQEDNQTFTFELPGSLIIITALAYIKREARIKVLHFLGMSFLNRCR